MNKFLKFSLIAILFAGVGIALNSCKKDFDAPPGPTDPNIVANTTIKALKALHQSPGAYDVINDSLVIEGVVIANDRSGNLYKQLFIQDATGALQILLDANSLFGSYPVGRKIFIRCKGLCISDYNGTPQLGVKALVAGLPSFEAIPGAMISKYVVGGSLNNSVSAKSVTIADLDAAATEVPYLQGSTSERQIWQNKYLCDLIQMENFEFADTLSTYSDTSVYKATQNKDIKNCEDKVIIVRTSAYANFAGQKVAAGKGTVKSIYTIFRSSPTNPNITKQLLLRDLDDVQFTGLRCSIFEESFSAIGANGATLSGVPGWSNISETGTAKFQNAVFGSGPMKCAKITAFSSGQSTVTSWLISPPVNLTGYTTYKLRFTTSAGFPSVQTPDFKVYISTTYNGSTSPSTFFTNPLPAIIAVPVTGFGPFISSGNLDLSAYAGQTIYIGFRYDGGDPSKTATYEVDDVKVTGQ
ncbi:MAG: choice-of-anchor J domain-containing protein [Rhizobacter sp.]|nr:choice-of-anchor J domain-containing protein [Ferruginibacter sp.]